MDKPKPDSLTKFKKAVFRILAIIAGFLLIPVFICWIVLTQPFACTSRLAINRSEDTAGGNTNPDRLKAHVLALTGQFHPRDCEHVENLDRAAEYIGNRFLDAGARVEEQPYEARGKTYRNVIGKFGPETGEPVIVGAHYDAVEDTPGADDNASAVAGLIELGFLLKGTALSAPVWLVAYSLEEPPYFATEYMGSAVHARFLKEDGQKIRVMICLEMIGYFTDAENSQSYPAPGLKLFYPSVGNFIAVVGKLDQRSLTARVKKAMSMASDLPVHSISSPRALPGIDFSDHRSYWSEGYPAVMITDTAFYRNPNYHTPGDTPETLDYTRMAMVVRGVHQSILDFAGNAEIP